jgi:hypothetical protein
LIFSSRNHQPDDKITLPYYFLWMLKSFPKIFLWRKRLLTIHFPSFLIYDFMLLIIWQQMQLWTYLYHKPWSAMPF